MGSTACTGLLSFLAFAQRGVVARPGRLLASQGAACGLHSRPDKLGAARPAGCRRAYARCLAPTVHGWQLLLPFDPLVLYDAHF